MKFTKSEDGVERADVLLRVRLSREDIAEAKEKAKADGVTWREWIADEALSGIEAALINAGGEYEQRYGKGDDC